jgi:hypothetical protein
VRERTAYSSRECSACGYTHADNRPGKPQELFQCQACGYTDHADVNAPKTLRKRSLVKGRFGDHLIPTPEERTIRTTNLPGKTLLSTGELDLAGGTPVTARQGRQALDANEQHDPSLDQCDQRDQSTLITDSSGLMEGQLVQRQRVLVKRHLRKAGIRGNTLADHSGDQEACEQQDYQHALGPPE